jgi:hypothetical protein
VISCMRCHGVGILGGKSVEGRAIERQGLLIPYLAEMRGIRCLEREVSEEPWA